MSSAEPVVVEFAGLPAAGKTTTAHLLLRRLSDLGVRCVLVPEAAARSPLAHLKRDWRFNAWTLCDAVSGLLEHSEEVALDLIVFDRGLVDALCWISWFRARGEIDTPTADALESFARVPTWFRETDLTFILRVGFENALKRRGGTGRILNAQTFSELRDAYDRSASALLSAGSAPQVRVLDTDHLTPSEVLDNVISVILKRRPEWQDIRRLTRR